MCSRFNSSTETAPADTGAKSGEEPEQIERQKTMETTQKERFEVLAQLQKLGFDYDAANKLRRIAMTLRAWFEAGCGDVRGNCIERDEATGKPYRTFDNLSGPRGRYAIADREAGAKRRLAAIMVPYKRRLVSYIQGDCRGASLYILRKADVKPGESLDGVYHRGVAVY